MKNLDKCRSLLDVTNVFRDESACRKHLELHLWPEGKPVCPHCATQDKIYRFKDGKLFKCATCNKQFTVLIGTIFERSHISLLKWFMAIWCVTNKAKGIASTQLADEIGVQQRTAWFMLQRIRHAMENNCKEVKLSGTVEADEYFLTPESTNIHESKKKKMRVEGKKNIDWSSTTRVILGIVQRKGSVYFKVIHKANNESIKPEVLNVVEQGSQLITDGLSVYKTFGDKYVHSWVDHTGGEYVRGKDHTNSIESQWALFARGYMGVYHKMSTKHLQFYLSEYAWRHNHRDLTKQGKMDRVIAGCLGRITYRGLNAKPTTI